MTWLQFISSIIGSLAWPVCAVIIALVFRKRFSDLLAKLLKVNLPGGISAEFEKGLARVEETTTIIDSIESIPRPDKIELSGAATAVATATGSLSVGEAPDILHASGTVSDPLKTEEVSRTERNVTLNDLSRPDTNVFDFYDASVAQPAGVVMEAWKLLEAELVSTVEAVMPSVEHGTVRGARIVKLLTILVEKGVLSEQDAVVFRDLQRLRNLAVHSSEPVSPSEARRFATLAANLGTKLKRRPGPTSE